MPIDKRQVVSAQVMLKSASGRSPDGTTPITSANVREFLPSHETVAKASRAFAAKGFEVGPAAGNSFSITAPARLFERVFKARLHNTERGGIQCRKQEEKDKDKEGSDTYNDNDSGASEELPLGALPKPLASEVVAVTFSPPPDFGPSNF